MSHTSCLLMISLYYLRKLNKRNFPSREWEVRGKKIDFTSMKKPQKSSLWSGIWSVATSWIGFWTWILRSGLLILILGKLSWFHLTSLITMVLLMWKWMGLFLRKNHLLRCWGWPSLLNWIRVLTLSLLIKLPPRKLEL